MRVDLGGRVALVAGGAPGRLGAIAAVLTANGATVVQGAAVEEALQLHGRLDAVVGAGDNMPIQQAADAMAARGGGRIVQIASVAGLVPPRGHADVSAAAASVFVRVRSMALDYAARGVLVNAIATTGQDVAGESGALDAHMQTHIPLGRVATDAEVGNAVLFLLAPASSYVTGHVMTLDGGWCAGFARDF